MPRPSSSVLVIGGGLAGSEAALQLAAAGCPVTLCEMRPLLPTPAHQGGDLGELVCSNSLGSDEEGSAARLLKDELRFLGCRLLALAEEVRLPAGKALAVDRQAFARRVTEEIAGQPLIAMVRREVEALPEEQPAILASGPLTSPTLAAHLAKELGQEALSFYDAISPTVYGDSLDREQLFAADRRGPGEDYWNCPLSRPEYERFLEALRRADLYAGHGEGPVFEGCLPIEVLAARGPESLRFGPMKPVGLTDPRSGRRPYAVLQLRRENREGTLWNLVGFQTRLRKDEQQRVLRLIPALRQARFARFGGMHRNTFLFTPAIQNGDLSLRRWPRIFLAGQLSGVEGYVESIASGLLAARNLLRKEAGEGAFCPPEGTALRALLDHLGAPRARPQDFQPMNINFGIIRGYAPGRGEKKAYRRQFCREALDKLRRF